MQGRAVLVLALLCGAAQALSAERAEVLYGQTCAVCHGAGGEGRRDLQAPAIAGQYDWYLQRQLAQFREGPRGRDKERDASGATMRGIAASVATDDVAALAVYVSMLPPATAEPWPAGDASVGRGYYEICASCHGVRGEGNVALQAPRLAGLDGQYLFDQLLKFKAGVRGGTDGDTLGVQMKSMAEVLPDEDTMHAVVAFIATLP